MSDLEVILLIALVIGVIVSNLAVLKYSAKFKLPQFGDPKKPTDRGTEQNAKQPHEKPNNAKSDKDVASK